MNAVSISKTKEILSKYGFQIKKKFGQNFLIDENILKKIVGFGEITNETGVIEIGPGIGSLTQYIALNAKKVLAYEIDEFLLPILKETLSVFNNITVLNQDILTANVELDIKKYLKDCKSIVVVANLPYYITTPILMHLLENNLPIDRYVVMMQKEVADRIASSPNVKDYNSLSIAIQYRANAKKVMQVPKTVFIPAPNVDSTVLRLDKIERTNKPNDEAFFFDFFKCSFVQRRKTLVNNLAVRFNRNKEELEKILEDNKINKAIRAEALSLDDFIKLSDVFKKALETQEQWDFYDFKGELTGKCGYRGDVVPDGFYHLVVHIININSKGEYLIQRRSLSKIGFPGMWSITGGSVQKGESSIAGAKRELFEELGIDLPKEKFTLINRTFHNNYHQGYISDVYVVKEDISDVCIDNDEVIDYKWAKLEEIEKMTKEGKFVDLDLMKINLTK